MSLPPPTAVLESLSLAIGHPKPMKSATILPAQVESGVLLRGMREVLIRHGGEVYRLRHTRNDKLILTK